MICLNNFEAFWAKNKQPVLRQINLVVKKGELVGLIGKVGQGKSSLLYSLAREIPFYKGKFELNGSIAFVEQEPYIFSGTFKSNILMSKSYNEEFYKKTIEVCSLVDDLREMPDGDNTEIGERGLNISGGQKAR